MSNRTHISWVGVHVFHRHSLFVDHRTGDRGNHARRVLGLVRFETKKDRMSSYIQTTLSEKWNTNLR